ncbi:MAG: glycosyltransferase [Nitrosomonadales bacterium]|nr:MAG: glycosyltransferase [Nitrosomonadales bacterium]
MKFSVLLPTRNRLDLLSYAIETVRRQDYSDWEIIVSDNASEEDIAGYVRSINDLRIKYYRTEKLVTVTDNWNNALTKSNGDYVIMLGDDDCLMQGYFSTLKKIIEEYNDPELIYTSAFVYAYPGVMPGFPEGYLRSYISSQIFRSAQKPFWLEKSESMALVNHSVNFRICFDYNMQFSLVSRKFIQRLEEYGPFYQSPYPDYYASNAAMLKAENILIVPQPLVTIGISPKSFGFYYFNDLESKGNEFLKNIPDPDMVIRLQQVILPGTDMNTSWLLSMETLRQNFAKDGIVKVNYDRYRLLQICAVYARSLSGKYNAKEDLQNLKRKINLREWIFYGIPLCILTTISVIFVPKRYYAAISRQITRLTGSHPKCSANKKLSMIQGDFNTIIDVFEKAKPVFVSVKKQEVSDVHT